MGDTKTLERKTLKQLRLEQNLTQAKLAEKANVTTQLISFYELGKRNPTLPTAIRLAQVFNYPVEKIIFACNK